MSKSQIDSPEPSNIVHYPAPFTPTLKAETVRYAKIIKTANVELDNSSS